MYLLKRQVIIPFLVAVTSRAYATCASFMAIATFWEFLGAYSATTNRVPLGQWHFYLRSIHIVPCVGHMGCRFHI